MAEDTWESVAIPILEWLAEQEQQDSVLQAINIAILAAALDHDIPAIRSEVMRLYDAGYIGGSSMGGRLSEPVIMPYVGAAGMRAIGGWPTDDPYDGLLELIERQLVDDDVDEDTKSGLRELRQTLTGIGKSTAGALLTAYLKQQLGL